MKQHQAWATGGAADEWFERNKAGLVPDAPLLPSTRMYVKHISPGHRVLEIGTSNGQQLDCLRRLTGCKGFGIDPSSVAIQDGKVKFPELQLTVGTANELDFPENYFDAVILGFCLYLVDRSLLFRVVAETDRVLRTGGRLMVTDFDATVPHRRSFVHNPGVWSFKMNYPSLWLANPDYVLVEKCAYSHIGESFHPDPVERIAASVLAKQQRDYAYPEL